MAGEEDWAKKIGLSKRDADEQPIQDDSEDMGVVEASGELPPPNDPEPPEQSYITPNGAVWICLDCYSVAPPRKVFPGSGVNTVAIFGLGSLAVILGLFYSGLLLGSSFVIGAILFAYEGWRTGTAKLRCRHCGSARIIPPDSPRGRQLQGLE